MTCHSLVRRIACGWSLPLTCILLGFALPRVAHGYGENAPVDVEGLRIAPGDQHLVAVDLGRVGEHKSWVPQAFLHYADRPLALLCHGYCANRAFVPLVAQRITLDLSLAVSLWDRLQLGVSLPVVLYQQTDSIIQDGLITATGSPPVPQPAGLSDARLHAKVAFLPKAWKVGLGLNGTLSLPTGDGNSYLGTRLPSFTARLLGHAFAHARVTMGASFGARFAAQEQILGLSSGTALTYNLGIQLKLLGLSDGEIPLYLIAEAYGLAYVRASAATDFPTEFLLALKSEPGRFSVFAGGGGTLFPGTGTPDVRALVGFGYSSKR